MEPDTTTTKQESKTVTQEEREKEVRAAVNACLDASRGTLVPMAFEAVYALAKQNLEMRRTLALLASHDPSWKDDFCRAAAVLGSLDEATVPQ